MGTAYEGVGDGIYAGVGEVDYRDPMTILMERQGDSVDDVHSGWTSGKSRRATEEFEKFGIREREPNVDKFMSDETWEALHS